MNRAHSSSRPEPGAFVPFTVAGAEAIVLRAPTPHPIRTSFGVMNDRPAVLVRIRDETGAEGWGECWCNFPAGGAEHRARLIEGTLLPSLQGATVVDPVEITAELTERTRVLAIQSGEFGPFAQAIAGLDMALWDLAAKRTERPLWQLLGGEGEPSVPVYASGINPDRPERVVERQRALGFNAFKLKIGFGLDIDLENVARLRSLIGPGAPLMADANQAWELEEAIGMCRLLEPFEPQWLEEPLAADRPASEWRTLAGETSIRLAAGENLRGRKEFDRVIRAGHVAVIQPDAAKWGGLSGCREVARRALAAGRRFCPHFLGSGIGLLASGHLLKAVGGGGLLEVDVNDNPLQREVLTSFPSVVDGRLRLPDGPGLGVLPDLAAIARYRR